ncbi:DUF1559 domain-containing protein [Blastopirellula marina]|uniref:DUF1559 domain-containing protein n=1 Tax=Blastopirellula marina TaxID=124 RepID=A0A2S8FHV6_9BACT|nr:DUF1559 domain-containing protein [Blastopirellula marina]PQO31756.1 hypothetical protein C5Y98_20300 [Blastopirellula marina]PTL43063.1 DUF1559 domain-containing protein [Blastopirellula marina]
MHRRLDLACFVLFLAIPFCQGCQKIEPLDGAQSGSGGEAGSAVASGGGTTNKPTSTSTAGMEKAGKNMKRLLLALHNYHDTHGKFPPAYTKDENGQPLTSWRVLVLPQLGHQDIYNQYDQSKPWDSPENLALSKSTPDALVNPLIKNSTGGLTPFVAVVGPNTVLSTEKSHRFIDLRDGLANTAIFIEDLNHPVIWSQPTDLSPEELLARASFEDNVHGGTQFAIADGHIFQYGNEDREKIGWLIDISNGL